MNHKKWNNSRIPLPVLAAKFAEEAGEVAGAIADREVSRLNNPGFTQVKHIKAVHAEISHARFLLDLIEERAGYIENEDDEDDYDHDPFLTRGSRGES